MYIYTYISIDLFAQALGFTCKIRAIPAVEQAICADALIYIYSNEPIVDFMHDLQLSCVYIMQTS